MSDSIRIIFTKRKWNPFSWLIRWALPRSRFSLALASHSIIVDGAYAIEAHMLYGVRRVLLEVALVGLTEVARRDYAVPDAQGGIEWARTQVCIYQAEQPHWMPNVIYPAYAACMLFIHNNYDWDGAFGLALAPDRDWQEEDLWECFELSASTLHQAGRHIFSNVGHISGTSLLSIQP